MLSATKKLKVEIDAYTNLECQQVYQRSNNEIIDGQVTDIKICSKCQYKLCFGQFQICAGGEAGKLEILILSSW